jgi:(p)ppGpp synthase/HD superfamily hydrolase
MTESQLPPALITGDKDRNARFLRAYRLAAKAHDGQTRKNLKTPYILHPERVAYTVMIYGGTEPEVIAALWHDVIEDCGGRWYTEMKICLDKMDYSSYTKKRIIDMVRSLTKDHSLGYRAEKNKDALNRCQAAGTEFLKLCDRLDNIRDTVDVDDEFLTKYLQETELLLERFKMSGVGIKDPDSVYNAVKKEVERVRQARNIR